MALQTSFLNSFQNNKNTYISVKLGKTVKHVESMHVHQRGIYAQLISSCMLRTLILKKFHKRLTNLFAPDNYKTYSNEVCNSYALNLRQTQFITFDYYFESLHTRNKLLLSVR